MLLVAATFGAFFVAQELKSRPPVVQVNKLTRFFSPNGDGRRDVNSISVVIREADDLTIGIVNADGDRVRRLATNVAARPYQPVRVTWDGRDDEGRRAADGIYRLRVGLRRQGRSVVVQQAITLDTVPPRPLVRAGGDDRAVISPRGGPVPIRIRGAGRRAPDVSVWRTDVSPARRVARVRASRGGRAEWDPTPSGGAAAPGIYLIEASARDRAGNVGSSAPGLPRLPDEVRGRPGVTIRALAVQPPVFPQRAGQPIDFLVDSRQRPYRWSSRRLGRARAGSRGSSATGDARLTIRAPSGASGIHLLEIRSGTQRTRVPYLVQAEQRAPLLVVVPAITWLGRDRIDDDGDGLPNTLERGSAVSWPRPLSGDGGLPSGFADHVAPLLVALDRAGIPYDITTDLALARKQGPRPSGHRGVLLAGSLRWIPRSLALELRRYVNRGGRVGSIGVESMRRGVVVGPERLTRPTQPVSRDPFGANFEPLRRIGGADGAPPLEVLVEEPGLGLFEGSDGVLAGFEVVEEARRPESSPARLLAALGQPFTEADAAAAERAGEQVREPLPVLAATRIGRGLVIRVGLPAWPQRLIRDAEVDQIHRNLVDLLRGVQPRVRSAPR